MESPIEALLSLSFKDFCFLLGMDLLLWFVLSILLEIVKRLEKGSDSLIWPVLALGLAFLLNLALVVGFPGTLFVSVCMETIQNPIQTGIREVISIIKTENHTVPKCPTRISGVREKETYISSASYFISPDPSGVRPPRQNR